MYQNDEEPKKKYLVPAVDQAVRVMLCLVENGNNPTSLTDICREVGIHRSKAFSILNTLLEYDLIKKNPNRKGYILGPGLLTLTGKMLENLNLSHIVDPVLYELAKKAGATVALGVISDHKAYVISQYEGAPGIGISSPIGYVTPITYGSHGKAIAACLSEDDLYALMEENELSFYGRPEKFDKSRLMEELDQIRRDGFAMEFGDVTPGVNAVAAPVLDQNGKPVGYVTIVGFFTEEEAPKLGRMAVEAVRTISNNIGHMMFWQKASSRKQKA